MCITALSVVALCVCNLSSFDNSFNNQRFSVDILWFDRNPSGSSLQLFKCQQWPYGSLLSYFSCEILLNFPIMSFVPEDCMTSFVFHPHLYLLQKFLFILSSLVPQTHICSLSSTNSPLFTHFPHADTRG